MFDQLSAEILVSLIKGFPTTTTTTTKQNVDPAVHFVYSRVKSKPLELYKLVGKSCFHNWISSLQPKILSSARALWAKVETLDLDF
jgi:hypothetical protein